MKKNSLRLLLILIIAAMLFSLTACGEIKAPEETPAVTQDASAAPAEPGEAEAYPAEPREPAAPQEPEVYGARRVRYSTDWIEELRKTLPELPDIDIESWEFLIANSYNCITQFNLNEYDYFEGQGYEAGIVDPLEEFLKAGRDAGYELLVATGFRNFIYIKTHYVDYCQEEGSADAATRKLLPPGCNEHQTGLAVDLTTARGHNAYYDEFSNEEFLETDAFKWALEHCSEYGFIYRYPEGKEEFYGVPCHCAGHFRYVGKEAAEFITENNLCLEEFIALYDPSLLFIPSKISD